jgi:hypothetical protein
MPTRQPHEAVLKMLRTHPDLRALGKHRARIVLLRPKPSHRGEPEGTQLVAGIYDYDDNRSFIALVDTRAKRAIHVERPPASFQLSDDERKEAETLAAKDARVRQFVGRRKVNPLTRLYFPPLAEGSGRFAIVFIRPSVNARRYAVIDLSAQRVAAVLTREELTRG